MSAATADDSKAIVAKTLASVGELATLPEVTVKIINVVEDPNGTAGVPASSDSSQGPLPHGRSSDCRPATRNSLMGCSTQSAS